MIPVITTLIIIGGFFFIASFFFHEKPSSHAELTKEDREAKDDLFYKEMLSETLEETIHKTEDELSKLSNEKIIAVHDFSNQVLDKISVNHEEVVFLYNMLSEKEAELKELLVKARIEQKDIVQRDVVQKDILQKGISQKNILQKDIVQTDIAQGEMAHTDITQKERKAETIKDPLDFNKKALKDVKYQETKELMKDYQIDDLTSNHNKDIMQLYKEGYSVMEIAKRLDLGQGEVKLVIDLQSKGLEFNNET